MSANPFAVAARQSLYLVIWQSAWVAVVAAVGTIVWGGRVGGSLLAGGCVGLVWTVYMAFTLYRHSLDYGARVSAASLLKGWLLKIAITLGLMVVAFRSERLAPLALLAGLMLAMLAYGLWFALDLQRRWSPKSKAQD